MAAAGVHDHITLDGRHGHLPAPDGQLELGLDTLRRDLADSVLHFELRACRNPDGDIGPDLQPATATGDLDSILTGQA